MVVCAIVDRGSRIVAETAHGLFEQSFESIDVGFVPTLFATVGGTRTSYRVRCVRTGTLGTFWSFLSVTAKYDMSATDE